MMSLLPEAVPSYLISELNCLPGGENELESDCRNACQCISDPNSTRGPAPLIQLFVWASKNNIPKSLLAQFLKDDLEPQFIKLILDSYEKHQPTIRSVLSRVGWRPERIIDIDWELFYSYQSNVLSRPSEPTYMISLETASGKDANVTCSVNDLQHMLWKLKEASKAIEKSASVSSK